MKKSLVLLALAVLILALTSCTTAVKEKVIIQEVVVEKPVEVIKYVDRVVTEIDTVYTNEVKYPTYRSSFDKDGWVKGNIIARVDSTQIDLKIKNAYGVVLGQEKTGFLGLGKPKTFVDVLSYNPYSESTAVRALQVQLPKQNKGKYIIGGIVIGAIGGILLVK